MDKVDTTIINGYLTEYMKDIENNMKNGKVMMGYTLKDDGTLELTNEKVFEHNSDAEIDAVYSQFKDCYAYSKAIEKFNSVYNNAILNQKAQIEASLKFKEITPHKTTAVYDGQEYVMYNKFDINLVLLDTCLLYEKLADNDIILENKKKFKLLTNKIEPKTAFIKMANIVELAFKNYKKFDRRTQKQLLALVLQTIGDADKF